jgi:hypothetical protein
LSNAVTYLVFATAVDVQSMRAGRRGVMKIAMMLLVCGLSTGLAAQKELRSYTSPDGVFRFQYSRELVRCTFQKTGEGGSGNWVPDDCADQGFLCGTDESTNTFACVAYPSERFRNKPEFGKAAFFVAKVADATSAVGCRQDPQGWVIDKREDRRLNGIPFRVFHTSDAWMSHSEAGEIYRAFHNGVCYEIGIQQVFVSAGAFDEPIARFTKEDQAEVDRRLREALRSFRFLR